MTHPVIRLTEIGVDLPGGSHLLQGITFSVSAGESLAITGRSGSGKSTLLATVALMNRSNSGSLTFNGLEMTTASTAVRDRVRRTSVGFVFQKFVLISHLSVLENVVTPLRYGTGMSERHMHRLAEASLDSVGMLEHRKKRPNELSGGEQQRVAICRALVREPQLILADEPTGSLDENTGREIVDLLTSRIRKANSALVVVTHDREIARNMERELVLGDGNFDSDQSSRSRGRHSRSTAV
jgi:putative ABC transport system ATP-binding protein